MNVKKKHLAGIQKPSLLVLGENTPFISFHSTNISFQAPNHLFARSEYRSHFKLAPCHTAVIPSFKKHWEPALKIYTRGLTDDCNDA